jgi:hypothetical protein
MKNIGAGIAIVGIWIGVGIVALSGQNGWCVFGVAVMAMIATGLTGVFSAGD